MIVEVNGEPIEFPDTMSDAEVVSAIKKLRTWGADDKKSSTPKGYKDMSPKELRQLYRGEYTSGETKDVTLPNGYVYKNVPIEDSSKVVLDRALKEGKITADEFIKSTDNSNDFKDVLKPYLEPMARKVGDRYVLNKNIENPFDHSAMIDAGKMQPQGVKNRALINEAFTGAVDFVAPAVAKAIELNRVPFNKLDEMGVPFVKSYSEGLRSGIGNALTGTSQFLYDAAGNVFNADYSKELQSIDDFRKTKPSVKEPELFRLGEFIGEGLTYAPFAGYSLPQNALIGGVIGATNYQNEPDFEKRQGDRLVDTGLGVVSSGIPAVVLKGYKPVKAAIEGLSETVKGISKLSKEGAVEAGASMANTVEDVLDLTLPASMRPNRPDLVSKRVDERTNRLKDEYKNMVQNDLELRNRVAGYDTAMDKDLPLRLQKTMADVNDEKYSAGMQRYVERKLPDDFRVPAKREYMRTPNIKIMEEFVPDEEMIDMAIKNGIDPIAAQSLQKIAYTADTPKSSAISPETLGIDILSSLASGFPIPPTTFVKGISQLPQVQVKRKLMREGVIGDEAMSDFVRAHSGYYDNHMKGTPASVIGPVMLSTFDGEE